jgi:glycine/D-amino acid oxidase-like deaminating enzyme
MNLTVIGLGYVGLPLAIYSARAGLSVKGFDVDEAKISNLNNGHSFLSEFDSKEILDLLDARKLKFVDKLRDLAEKPTRFPDFGEKNIVVRFNKDSGHFGTTDNEVNLAMATFEFAWLDYIMFKKHNL